MEREPRSRYKVSTRGKPMGTCRALSLIDLDNVDEPILVTNGDLLTDIDYSKILEFHLLNECDAVMCVREEKFFCPIWCGS